MLKFIDNFLNSITMYRLVLYGLFILAGISLVFGFLGILPFTVFQLGSLLVTLILVCYVSNVLLAKIFGAITNNESYPITALILFFILAPIINLTDVYVSIVAGILAMASKYLLAIHKKHIFNPAAVAVFILGLFGFGNGIWWVGSAVLLPFVLLIGFLVVRKIRKFTLLFSFLMPALITICLFNITHNVAIEQSLVQSFLSWPLIFFGTIMLTEPETTPPTKKLYTMYGALTGIFFGLQFHIGFLFSSPEFALVAGNVFSFLVSPKQKLFLHLKQKVMLAPNIYEFIFSKDSRFNFIPGQYLEWTLPGENMDTRGNRRYFSIASSPGEDDLRIGVKIVSDKSSSFKKEMLEMNPQSTIVASQLSGDFTLPTDKNKRMVFIAGGIGITPFRSILKNLLDQNERREIIMFYTCVSPDEFVYKDVFKKAEEELGIKTVYVVTDASKKSNWNGEVGYLNREMIEKYVLNYKERSYYISGPNVMVESYRDLLLSIGIKRSNIITDYFSGY